VTWPAVPVKIGAVQVDVDCVGLVIVLVAYVGLVIVDAACECVWEITLPEIVVFNGQSLPAPIKYLSAIFIKVVVPKRANN